MDKKNKTIYQLTDNDIKTLDEFVNEYALNRTEGTTLVFSKNLEELKNAGYSVELLLDYLSSSYGKLFFGSRKSINGHEKGSILKPNETGINCCTNLGAVAILNALINKDMLSSYGGMRGMKIRGEIDATHPFSAEIYGFSPKALNEEGFVYVIRNTADFEKTPFSTWQFINKNGNPVMINSKIPVNNYDFKHKLRDVTGNKDLRLDTTFRKNY